MEDVETETHQKVSRPNKDCDGEEQIFLGVMTSLYECHGSMVNGQYLVKTDQYAN